MLIAFLAVIEVLFDYGEHIDEHDCEQDGLDAEWKGKGGKPAAKGKVESLVGSHFVDEGSDEFHKLFCWWFKSKDVVVDIGVGVVGGGYLVGAPACVLLGVLVGEGAHGGLPFCA